MSQPRLYGELAYLWPVISPPEEYLEEADVWRLTILDKLGQGRHRVLELGSVAATTYPISQLISMP